VSAAAHIYIPGQAEVPRLPREHPGKKTRTTQAGWVLDYLVPKNHTIILCQFCNHKFDGKKVNYISLLQRFGYVRGTCDGCKEIWQNCHMWVHERFIGTKSGQCWDSRYL